MVECHRRKLRAPRDRKQHSLSGAVD
jgi:hypothetical protein